MLRPDLPEFQPHDADEVREVGGSNRVAAFVTYGSIPTGLALVASAVATQEA